MDYPSEAKIAYNVVECLNQVFADINKLQFNAYVIHYNITGCFFRPIHKFAQEIYEALEEQKDVIAEQIRQLDGTPLSSLSAIIQWSQVTDMPAIKDKDAILTLLASDISKCMIVVQKCLEICDGQKDYASLDHLTKLYQFYSKYLWMTKSQINSERVQQMTMPQSAGER